MVIEMCIRDRNLPDANLDESGLSFYNGSSFPQPYLIAPKTESRAVTYASEDYRIACDYSTGGTKYGFIKEFESTSEKITGYMDFGIENGEKPVIGNAYETPLYPGSSRLRNIDVYKRQVYGGIYYYQSQKYGLRRLSFYLKRAKQRYLRITLFLC